MARIEATITPEGSVKKVKGTQWESGACGSARSNREKRKYTPGAQRKRRGNKIRIRLIGLIDGSVVETKIMCF